tara:strand:+ start:122 stop:1171 length:1050 start_codon:yes stop_codon:yes gene_type:complete
MKFPKSNKFELELTSKCTIRCPKCPRTFQQDTKHLWDNGNIDHIKLIKFLQESGATDFRLTGAYGDALYHPHLVDTIRAIKEMGATFIFNTNGSYRKEEDWEEIANVMTENDLVEFSIDGTPDNFTEYRVNGDWKSIEIGMQTLQKHNANMRWKYIIFKYNESYEDMKTAYTCANRLGVRQFVLVHTHRAIPSQLANKEEFLENLDRLELYVNVNFNSEDSPVLMISVTPRTNAIKSSEIVKTTVKRQPAPTIKKDPIFTKDIFPQCINIENYTNFVSSDGLFLPCCFMRVDKIASFKEAGINEEDIKGLNIENNTLDEIIKGTAFNKFMENFDNMQICRTHCNKNKVK